MVYRKHGIKIEQGCSSTNIPYYNTSHITKWINGILCCLLVINFIFVTVTAHEPSHMVLNYNVKTQTLDVTILHFVANPETHYVNKVEIKKNGVIYSINEYTSQPNSRVFVYKYEVNASDGDVLEVSANCNQGGYIMQLIVITPVSTNLAYDSVSHNFENVKEGQIYQTQFDIWNSGDGTLAWKLSDNYEWLTYYPAEGSSTGENSIVTVMINTTGLKLGGYSGEIEITSTGGKGVFIVTMDIEDGDEGDNGNESGSSSTPGFELIPAIVAVALVLFLRRKR